MTSSPLPDAAVVYDAVVRGGEALDPANGVHGSYDVGIRDGVIAAVEPALPLSEATRVIDARGQYVTPGLVDLHTHCYWGVTYWGVEPDPIAARSGVTVWVDAGSAGAYTFPGFRRYAVEASAARLFALLNVSAIGLVAPTGELANPDYRDVGLAAETVESNRDTIRGIKVRVDRDTTRGAGLEPLRQARELADRVRLPLMAHIASAPPHLAAIADVLRPGDILTHCCTGQDNRLADAAGHVYPFIRQLWEDGVLLDVGHGTGSFSYRSARRLLDEGIVPDVISSDIHQLSARGPMHDLPTTLSKFLNLGLSIDDAIARATTRPATAIGRPDLGALRVGSPADLALFRLEEGEHVFYDCDMHPIKGALRLVNTATYIGGTRLPRLPERPPAPWVSRDMPVSHRDLSKL